MRRSQGGGVESSEPPERVTLKHWKLIFLFVGIGLLVTILRQTDLDALWAQVRNVGWGGAAFVLGLYLFTFWTDVVSWQLTFQTVPLDGRWCRRLYLIRMVGEAFNNVTPTASVGGEPIKALLLKTHYRLPYRESGVSLVLAKTTNMLGLILFLAIGFCLMLAYPKLDGPYSVTAGLGLAALGGSTVILYLLQRYQVTSAASGVLSRTRFGRRLAHWLEVIEELDGQLLRFYTRDHLRFAGSLGLAFLNWTIGVLEIYVVMHLLGHPIDIHEAWILEAMVQLVRAAAFVIPAGIGAQEGVFLIVGAVVTGVPTAGLAFALVRRSRELVWISLGLALWWLYSLRRPPEALGPDDDATPTPAR